jgi:hypothetical protein
MARCESENKYKEHQALLKDILVKPCHTTDLMSHHVIRLVASHKKATELPTLGTAAYVVSDGCTLRCCTVDAIMSDG